ncbi:hypothetical protein ANO11243_026200 [Dothideomycetidae sp. 11243]|nr:hypothetical protein ANO11243_026200 [fungal sp. No.11243]
MKDCRKSIAAPESDWMDVCCEWGSEGPDRGQKEAHDPSRSCAPRKPMSSSHPPRLFSGSEKGRKLESTEYCSLEFGEAKDQQERDWIRDDFSRTIARKIRRARVRERAAGGNWTTRTLNPRRSSELHKSDGSRI